MSEIYDKNCGDFETDGKRNRFRLKRGDLLPVQKARTMNRRQKWHAAKILGASAVGMSTGCEAIAANHMGMQICGISCVTNMAAGMSENPLSHQEVQENAAKAAPYTVVCYMSLC